MQNIGCDSADLRRAVARGRRIVLSIAAFTIGISVFTIVCSNAAQGDRRLPTQLFRLAATVILAVFLYNGHAWARKVMAFLCGAGGLLALAALRVGVHAPIPFTLAYLGAMGVGYIACYVALVNSSSVRSFMSNQRASQQWGQGV
jgi:hypothetical protein